MIFNSLTFLLFLLFFTILYWILKDKYRLALVFLSSLIFYGFWKIEFLLLILFSTFLDFEISKRLDKISIKFRKKRKFLLILSLVTNLGLLIYFKYLYFIADNINDLFIVFGKSIEINLPNIILPLGISFYTFQTISYTVDVFRKHVNVEKNFLLYGCYVTFFPQLIAGPVLRAGEVIPQIKNRSKFRFKYISDGIERILYGLFLKVVLADNIAPLVDEGFLIDANSLSGIDVFTLAFLFGFQIYFDFAGYSHIAIGCANMMGINFPENFNYPYAARSFKSFWKRWHISLSSWIRDYLYLPLQGIKVIDRNNISKGGLNIENIKIYEINRNKSLFITWALMGLWHGANWTFIFWGVYHSITIFFERLFSPIRKKIHFFNLPIVGWLITLVLSMLSWIPFRAESLNDTFIMYSKIFSMDNFLFISMRENIYLITFILLVFCSLSFLYSEYISQKLKKAKSVFFVINTIKFTAMFYFVYIFLRPVNQFIYFQF